MVLEGVSLCNINSVLWAVEWMGVGCSQHTNYCASIGTAAHCSSSTGKQSPVARSSFLIVFSLLVSVMSISYVTTLGYLQELRVIFAFLT